MPNRSTIMKPGEDHENLPPRPRHELQRVVKPVPAAQHHLLVLRMRRLELRIGDGGKEGDRNVSPPEAR